MVFALHIFKWIEFEWLGDGILFFIFWTIGFWICLSRYRMLSLTPEPVSRDVVTRVDELVVLINTQGEIKTALSRIRRRTGLFC
ncbi:MAG: hypothetical protein JW822_13430 [Spirochaetales bacterium]|nr:hypothetical protein [Spirochaetales bacterium]